MPPKHSDARPRDKLLTLYQRLTLNGRKHFQADLAAELECSPQTVARLVEIIQGHLGKDAEIECGLEGRRRFYRFRSAAQEQGLGFDFEELHYLAMGRDLAAQFLSDAVAQRITRSITALALHLVDGTDPVGGQSIAFRNKGFIDYTPHLGTITTLRQAIADKQICRVVYTAVGRHSSTVYRYAPGRILAQGGTLYVQGYRLEEDSLLQSRPTTFSLHRIREVMPVGQYFRFNACDDDARRFGLNWHEPRRVTLNVSAGVAGYIRDRVWSDDQTIVDLPDGSLLLTITTTSEKELIAWVYSFGGLVAVAS
ncbi:MAG: helix-turn-helix transcriptional regulator [Bacteroidota bacterium]